MNAVPERDLRAAQSMNAFFIAPAVRGLSWVVPDLNNRVGTDCRSHAVQCLFAGHTAIGVQSCSWLAVYLLLTNAQKDRVGIRNHAQLLR